MPMLGFGPIATEPGSGVRQNAVDSTVIALELDKVDDGAYILHKYASSDPLVRTDRS